MPSYETTRFGQIEVEEENILTFPGGPLGFQTLTKWTFIDETRCAPFRMLQSLDDGAVAFIMVDPLTSYPDYEFNLTPEDLFYIGARSVDEVIVFCMITIAPKVSEVTINLQGPFVINPAKAIGHQFILFDTEYNTRHPVL